MKKLHFISKESIPAEVSRSSDPVKGMLDCGLLDSLRAESQEGRGESYAVVRIAAVFICGLSIQMSQRA